MFPQNRGKIPGLISFYKKIGRLFSPDFHETGIFSKLENGDMSSLIPLTAGAGCRK